jgi:uncharacterized iron-regulated protein
LSGKLIPLRMRCVPCWLAAVFLVACVGRSTTVAPHSTPIIPESTAILDATTGAPIAPAELLRRAETADVVLLGESHDNTLHHQVRGALLTAARARRPAVVFEQFARTTAPIPPPAPGETEEVWLDAHSFDRKGWKWPLHAPIVDAAIAHARAIWGSGLSRGALSAVVRQGTDAAPPPLGQLIRQAPLDSGEKAAVDHELFAGHCGKLPSAMIPGMRAAQEVRDASMAEVLIAAGSAGPAWLIAGNGHVRMDIGVPRLLRRLAPDRKLLVVGIVERETEEAVPGMSAGRRYDVLIVTPAATREDPCAGL